VALLLVEERLAACAQVIGPVSSVYHWQGDVERAAEWYCHLKTTRTRFPALRARIRQLHPYQVPEIIAIPIVDGDSDYLRWVEASVEGRSASGKIKSVSGKRGRKAAASQ
jgi:periplasmic divalent cation tolerance protein